MKVLLLNRVTFICDQESMEHPCCDLIYMTDIMAEFECDVFFPEFDRQLFKLQERYVQNLLEREPSDVQMFCNKEEDKSQEILKGILLSSDTICADICTTGIQQPCKRCFRKTTASSYLIYVFTTPKLLWRHK